MPRPGKSTNAALCSTPRIEFGIVFTYDAVPDTVVSNPSRGPREDRPQSADNHPKVSMGLKNEMTLYGDAGIGLDTAPYVCYGIEGRSTLYAAVDAP